MTVPGCRLVGRGRGYRVGAVMRRADSFGAGPVDPEGLSGQTHRAAPPRAARRTFLRPPSLTGVVIGLLFMAASLVPALLPRPWYVQGGLSGLAIAVGYGAGVLVVLVWRRVRRHTTRSLSPRTVYLVAAAPVALVVWMVVIHLRWQTDIRVLMEMERGAVLYLTLAILMSVILGSVLIFTGRGIASLFRRLSRLLASMMPRPLAVLSLGVAVLIGFVVFFDFVVASRLVPALEAAHQSSDRRFDPGVEPPDSEMLSGSAGSLIEWERMGRQGRVFVSEAPMRDQLAAFSGEPAIDPIRIYVGLEVADTADSRAQLALAEMERTGAFQRDLIVLIAPTGSGWVDPYAIGPLEYMYNGDTAAVAVQYSYLASWMVMIRNQDLATEATQALYQAVSRRLEEEPESTRPSVLLYGESLGSFGWERTFDGLDQVVDAVDGALWVGPPRVNPLWRRLVSQRHPDSPIWRPVYQGGETVRFGPDVASLLAPGPRWLSPRVVYLQHASDPITWLDSDVFWNRPEWLDPPRGPDVSSHTPYVPIVTYFQMAIDLALGTNAPLGHGHKFGPAQAEAWSLILPPTGWTMEDTEALVADVDS